MSRAPNVERRERDRAHILPLGDCRRLATRCDRLAAVSLGSVHLAAAILRWL